MRVDNSVNDRVYPQKADFTFYGGIYRDVSLLVVNKNHIALGHFGDTGVKITPALQENSADIRVETLVEGSGTVAVELLDAEGRTVAKGEGENAFLHLVYPNRPLGFSEYGAEGMPNLHSVHPRRGDHTEEYQAKYHEYMLKCFDRHPWLWATHVWNMFDFAADGRDEGGKHGENQKGLVTFDRKIKKDPFYLYKAYWSKEPFVHLCGSRYVDRAEDVTEIKVYSNLPEVSLYKDGQLVETKQGDKVFTFQLPITGKHSIEARSGEHSSVILVNKVDAPNPDYAMDNRKNVTNWFDGELDESCWSVKDNMAAAMADPKAGPILKQIREKAAASRGDVAAAVKDNPALVAMMERAMQRMTIQSMLMQAGTSEEDIKQLNRVLQGISKD